MPRAFTLIPSHPGIRSTQRFDPHSLATDAESRGRIDKAKRHHALIARPSVLINQTDVKNETPATKAEKACMDLIQPDDVVRFTTVAARAQIGRATHYRDLQLLAWSTSAAFDRSMHALWDRPPRLRSRSSRSKVNQHEEQLDRLTESPRKR